jgi:hypothetical protein
MKTAFKYELGTRVKSKPQGFTGIITCRYDYLYGCKRYEVTPEKLDKDGKLRDAYVFDEDALVPLKGGLKDHKLQTGGPTPPPPTHRALGRCRDPGR